MELLIASAEAVRELASYEVCARRKTGSVVTVGIPRVTETEGGGDTVDLVVATDEQVDVFRGVKVQPQHGVCVAEWRAVRRVRRLNPRQEWCQRDRLSRVLLDAFQVTEEEELVLNDRAAHESAKLVPLEGRIDPAT